MLELLKDIWGFLKVRKKYWMLPVIVCLLVLAGLLALV